MTEFRTLARDLFDAGVAAADPARALARALRTHPLPEAPGRLILIAVGKAAPLMLDEALRHAGPGCEALAVTHHENDRAVAGARVLRAGHPVPDAAGAEAARAVLDLLDSAGPEDRVVALISGGGSALLPAPVAPLTLQDKAAVNEVLLAGGLDIVRMNHVRQQLSELKGGGFLRRAAPAPVTAYILSDVIGDDLRAIASGPTVGPIGTPASARRLLEEADLWDRLPEAARRHLERAPDPGPVPEAANHLIGSNRQSLQAMAARAEALDLAVRVVDDRLVGDVGAAAERILGEFAAPDRPTALLFGGETTVTLRGRGLGGRNQELALRVALGAPTAAAGTWAFLSGGTDGRDGPTDAAGGLVDAGTAGRIRASGLDPEALLADNDSYHALEAAGDLVRIPATGTNVADVQVLILAP
ncbi:glycerate kinase type-2 family protein [Roseivivax sp. CAU 1761]